MRIALVPLLALLAQAAGAETFRELLQRAAVSPDGSAEGKLEGLLADEIRARTKAGAVIGRVSRGWELDEPGCARYTVHISAVVDGEQLRLGDASLDMCEGGLPPAPVR